MKKNRYLQIGPYSSVGGVNIHILRLVNLFKGDFYFNFIDESPLTSHTNKEVFNLRSKNVFKYLRIISNANIVHIHTGIWWLRCIHIVISRMLNKKTIVTIHSMSNLQSKFSIGITRFCLLFVNHTIIVSNEIMRKLKVKKATLIPAFLPPNIENEPEIPDTIKTILEENSDKKIIVSNAFDLILHNGEDLYGLDILLDVAKKIKKENIKYKIIFILAEIGKNKNILDTYNEIIKLHQLENAITIALGPISFVKLMLKSDLVIRATNTDGDAITIREAIYLNKPIIASNVVKRPEGTTLFKTRDSDDLFIQIKKVFRQKESTQSIKDSHNYKKYYTPILDGL